MMQRGGKIYHVLWLENQYCQNDYITKAINRFNAVPVRLPMAFSTGLEQRKNLICMETQMAMKLKQSWERKIELETSGSPTSYYIAKLQSSKQHGLGTKTEIKIKRTE